jgi:hypothetical protein
MRVYHEAIDGEEIDDGESYGEEIDGDETYHEAIDGEEIDDG